MKVNPVGGGSGGHHGVRQTDAKDRRPEKPLDAAYLSHAADSPKEKVATYSRLQIASASAAARTGNVETHMATEARASKIAAIEKRIGEGVYNARETLERVAERLMEKWGLGPSGHHGGSDH